MRTICSILGTERKQILRLGYELEKFLKKKKRAPQFSYEMRLYTRSKIILLVEDFPIVRKYFSHIFRSIGYRVTAVSTGKAAIRRFSKEFDLIFLDVSLPYMDGISALQTIKQKQASYQRTPAPIIASMATSDHDYSRQCIKAGANKVLKKGYDIRPTALKRFLANCMESSVKEEEIYI